MGYTDDKAVPSARGDANELDLLLATRPTSAADLVQGSVRTRTNEELGGKEADGIELDASKAKVAPFNVEGIPFNPGNLSRKLTVVGLAVTAVFGTACLILGTLIRHHVFPEHAYSGDNIKLNIKLPFLRELYLLLLNLTFVKLSVFSCSTAHETALKWTLATEKDHHRGLMRLEFNANLRFLQASHDWRSANGLPANVIMAFCLVASYASSSMVFLSADGGADHNTVVPFVALIALGSVTLVQTSIATAAILTTDIPTWSSSPIDTAAVIVRTGRGSRQPHRCMHSLYDVHHKGPLNPRSFQKSGWDSHPQFRRFLQYIWLLLASGYYWYFILYAMMESGTPGSHHGTSLAPIPWSSTNDTGDDSASLTFSWAGEAPTAGLLWGLGILIGFQGGIVTTAVTCAELLCALLRDEQLWREAVSPKGTDPSPNPVRVFFINWQTVVLHLSDPVLNWLFGLAASVDAYEGFRIHPLQVRAI